MFTKRHKLKHLFITFLVSYCLIGGDVLAAVLDQYKTLNTSGIYGQFNSAVRKFNRGEFTSSEKQIAAVMQQYNEQKKDDQEWLAKANFLMARVKVSLKRDAFRDKDDIRTFFTASYNIYSSRESGEEVVKDNLAEVTFHLTNYVLSLPTSQRDQKDAEFIANLPEHMKLKMSDMWNVKLGLIQARLDEEAKKPVEARQTLLKFVERMPAGTAEKAHVYGRIGKFFDDEKNLKDAADYYTRAHVIYTRLGDTAHAGRIAYALQKVELYRGAYFRAIQYANEAIAWTEANERRAVAQMADAKPKADEIAAQAGAAASSTAARWPAADNEAKPVVHVKVDEVLEEYEVQNKILPLLNRGEAQLATAKDEQSFYDARKSFEDAGTLIDTKLDEFVSNQPGALVASSINSAPQGKTQAEKSLLLQLRIYKILSLVGEARATLPRNTSAARTRIDHAMEKFLPDVKNSFKKIDALNALIHSAFWQIAMKEKDRAEEAVLNNLAISLPTGSHALPGEASALATAVSKDSFEMFDSRAMWKVYYVQAKLALMCKDADKALDYAEKARGLAETRGFLHFAAKSYDMIALAKTLKANAKAELRVKAKAEESDGNEQDRAARLGSMKTAIAELEKAAAEATEKATELRNSCGLLHSYTGGTFGYTVLDEAGIV